MFDGGDGGYLEGSEQHRTGKAIDSRLESHGEISGGSNLSDTQRNMHRNLRLDREKSALDLATTVLELRIKNKVIQPGQVFVGMTLDDMDEPILANTSILAIPDKGLDITQVAKALEVVKTTRLQSGNPQKTEKPLYVAQISKTGTVQIFTEADIQTKLKELQNTAKP